MIAHLAEQWVLRPTVTNSTQTNVPGVKRKYTVKKAKKAKAIDPFGLIPRRSKRIQHKVLNPTHPLNNIDSRVGPHNLYF